MSEVQANATTAPTTSTATAKDDTNYLPQYMDKESPEVKREVEGLLQLTVDKGLLEGIKAAKSHNGFVIDAFHDALADKLYPELESRGLLK